MRLWLWGCSVATIPKGCHPPPRKASWPLQRREPLCPSSVRGAELNEEQKKGAEEIRVYPGRWGLRAVTGHPFPIHTVPSKPSPGCQPGAGLSPAPGWDTAGGGWGRCLPWSQAGAGEERPPA